MITLKFKYKTDFESSEIIHTYRKQYTSALHFAYNRIKEGIKEKDCEKLLLKLNNISLIKSFLKRCVVKHASQLYEINDNIIFGGRQNFIKRCNNKITSEEFKKLRLDKLFIIGEANQKGNRFIKIQSDLKSFLFSPEKTITFNLEIEGKYKKYKKYLKELYYLQNNKLGAITYRLDDKFIYLIFDESILNCQDYIFVKNRIFALDLNPNYIGWSIVDWKSSKSFKLIKSGVISIKDINHIDNSLKNKSNSSKEWQYIKNKRITETYEISKLLVNIAKYYKCELFVIEDLNIKPTNLGTKYNKLIFNQWNRMRLVNNLTKRCNIYKIKLLKIFPEYSSFIGNFLYRHLNLPDMILSSIELGRRAYEFNLQYLEKVKPKTKNIIQPNIFDFYDSYIKSLEEFNISREVKDFVEIYKILKNSKRRYRVSLDDLPYLKFSRCFSIKSKIKKLLI